jgi:hypothetical protein
MTKPKLLSAALIAAAVLATPAMAREHHVTARQSAEHAYASTMPGAGYYSDGRRCYPVPRVGAFATQPWDNDTPCEAVPGY